MRVVNARSGVYHCRGTTYYGNTNRGEYLLEPAAQNLRFRGNLHQAELRENWSRLRDHKDPLPIAPLA